MVMLEKRDRLVVDLKQPNLMCQVVEHAYDSSSGFVLLVPNVGLQESFLSQATNLFF